MDGFNDSLSQRFATPQDMIAANSQADAEEMQNLKDQVDKYEGVLDRFNETVESLDKKISEIKPESGNSDDAEEYSARIEGVSTKLQEHIHKENVRVYRNVQAAFADEIGKQTKIMNEGFSTINSKVSSQNAIVIKLEEEVAALHAKIDAAEAAKYTGKGKAVLSLQILIFIIALSDLAFNVLKFLGVF